MKIVLVSGGFDPIHSGHINYLEDAKKLGDKLIVGINSDAWLVRKKGRTFMPSTERAAVITALNVVDDVIVFDADYDADGSAIKFISDMCSKYSDDEVIFANGGDRNNANIPEMSITANNLMFEFGVGGTHKANSSSWILQEWKAPKTERSWGYYRVLHEVPGMKVKELTVEPGKSLSMQRHFKRNEYWIVSEGKCILHGDTHQSIQLNKHNSNIIPVCEWHQLVNPYNESCKIVEVQYGDVCEEWDIERR